MTTQQPVWKLVAQLGDKNPVEHGGLFVYMDTTGVYAPEAERLAVIDEDSDHPCWEVRRFVLENLKLVHADKRVYLVPEKYDFSWPHPLADYDEWFHKGLGSVAEDIEQTVEQMRSDLTSTDPCRRTTALQAIGDYHGWDNLDSYPRTFTSEAEVRERYKGDI